MKLTRILLAVVLAGGCSSGQNAANAPVDARRTGSSAAAPAPVAAADDWFVDRAEASGLKFSYFNGFSGSYYFPEMLPGGVALFDFDNDGDLDVLFAQGDMLGTGKTPSDARIQPSGPTPLKAR